MANLRGQKKFVSIVPPGLRLVERSVLPGFKLTMGLTVTYLSLVVLIPLSGLFLATRHLTFGDFCHIMQNDLVAKSFKLTFGASLCAALVNAVMGFIVAWVLVRYRFVGRRLLDMMVDLPFALPTAVSGIALAQIYSEKGWIGQFLPIPIRGTPIGVTLALIFIGLPFVIRTLQPAIADIDRELEEVSASLGATRWQTFWKVIFPTVAPSLLAGFTMAFARAIGEYGSVVFIAGNMQGKTEILPLIIFYKLGEHDYVGATTVAVSMLVASFALLFFINMIQLWGSRYKDEEN